jgi:hypothetical protein
LSAPGADLFALTRATPSRLTNKKGFAMPLSGNGMLLTMMDIAPEEEADFHRWYDREHFAERVGIEGFLEARRYVALEGQPKYLHLYTTVTFEVLDSPAYRQVLQNPTAWSRHHITKFGNATRVCGRVGASEGQGAWRCCGTDPSAPGGGGGRDATCGVDGAVRRA